MLSELISHGPVVRTLRRLASPLELQCVPTGAGYERRENETYSWEGSKRSVFAVIQHTIAGRGELDYAGTRHALLPGDTMVLTFPHANRYWLAPGRSWEYFWIGLHGREALRITRAIIDNAGPVVRPHAGAIDRLADSCLKLATGDLLAGEASGAAYAAAMALHDAVFGQSPPANVEHPPPIRRVEVHVEQSLAGNLSVDRLARVAGLSRAHFVRLFSASIGASPSAFVAARRLELAERLLLATDLTVEEIARRCGFANGNYFAKVFRRARGMAPRQYRTLRLRSAARQGRGAGW